MPVEMVVQSVEDGYVVSVDDARAQMAPVLIARFSEWDTAYLLLYVLGDGPGTRELCAGSPELVASLDAHCGAHRH